MKSKLFNIPKLGNHPIYAQYDLSEKFYGKFHYHEEIQLTHIKKGKGTLLCGSSSTHYQKDDFFIIGSMQPHVFIGESGILSESISIYCNQKWLSQLYPNSNYLDHFIKISKNGVKLKKWKYPDLMDEVLNKAGLYRITSFIILLERLSETNSKKDLIDNSSTLIIKKNSDSHKINEVFKFIADNIDKPIKLEDLSNITNLTPPSFSRYFKQKTKKTVSNYISELRIESACKLLQNEDLTVEEVGYKIGYNNFSNFLRQFKKIKKQTPKEFRKENYKSVNFN